MLEEDCDILIPCATEIVIHAGNAANIKAKVISYDCVIATLLKKTPETDLCCLSYICLSRCNDQPTL